MNNNWRTLFEAVGITAVVASLIFVGIQVRQEQEFASGQYAYDWLGAKMDFVGLISDNKSIWVPGLKGEELIDEDIVVFDAMVSTWIGFQIARYRNRVLVSGGQAEEVSLEVAHFLHAFPSLKREWRRLLSHQKNMHGPVSGMPHEANEFLIEIESGERTHIKPGGFTIF